MDNSIKKQMTLSFVTLIAAMILVSAIANIFFLEDFYTNNKKEDLLYTQNQLQIAYSEDLIDNETSNRLLQRIVEKGNIDYIVQNQYGKVINSTNQEEEWLRYQLTSYQLDKNPNKLEIIKLTESYEIVTALDPRNDLEYLEMWGYFPTGEAYILRTPIESIQASADLAARFLLYVASIVMVLSTAFVWHFGRKITTPILELAKISKSMANLEFDVKYEGDYFDEIEILGHNFNVMAEKLKDTISELKTANNELLQDIEMKEQVESMRTEFLANVSHELKTPIALIQGYAEGLKENVTGDIESREFYCEVIMDEADKMNQLVKNMLQLNQLEFGSSDGAVEQFDIMELIQGVLQSMDILIKQKEITLKIEPCKKVYVWGDQFKVEHILRNYLTNALNHIDYDKIIHIKVTDGNKVRVAIFNTGDQIPDEDLNHIWEKFYKVDKARTREYGGNGIGLSVVKAIMTSMHQEFGVKNYTNGVEFWFELDGK